MEIRKQSPTPVEPTAEVEASIKDYRHSGQFYPGPIHRLRPQCSQDNTKDQYNYCRKEYYDPKPQMGYLQIFRCLDHRFALGFHQGDLFLCIFCLGVYVLLVLSI